MTIPRAVLFTRFPTPGAAKTRLIPAIGEAGAARVHRQLTERTVKTLREAAATIEIHYTGADEPEFAAWLGGDLRFLSCRCALTVRNSLETCKKVLSPSKPFTIMLRGMLKGVNLRQMDGCRRCGENLC